MKTMGYIKKRYVLLIALAVILILAVTFFLRTLTIYSSQVIVKAEGEPLGFAPFEDRIDFGDIPQGDTVGKTLIVQNAGTVPNKISVFMIGGITDLVKYEPHSFELQPGETVEVKFQLTMPASATPGRKYSGKVLIFRLPQRLW